MERFGRREFIRRGSASLAGAMLAGSIVDRWIGADAFGAVAGEAPPIATGLPDRFIDDLATIVADLQRKFPYASALYAAQSGIGITRDRNGKRVSESGFPSRGITLRVFDGGAFHEASVSGAATDPVRAAARKLERTVAVAKERYKIEPLGAHRETWRTTMAKSPDQVSLAERLALVDQEFERIDGLDPRIRSARVSTEVNRVQRVFVDRHRRLASETTMISHNGGLFGFDQGKPGFAFERRTGQGGLELATLTDEAIERMRRHFGESFATEPVPAGEYEVVFAPPVSGLLAHESFGHGVEMDQFVKDRAKAREFLGKKVASDIVTLLDDPSIPGARGSYPFDDEGVLAGPTRIIENGVFVQPLTDLMSATFLGTRRTPNGRAQSWDRKVYARMSNTFFARGTSDRDEVLASLKDGLYVEGFRNGIEDPQGWGIQFTAATAREYRNGKPTGRIFAPATITGYVPEILSNITMIASDFELEPGTCGKGHKEYVPVTSGGPHVRTRARVS